MEPFLPWPGSKARCAREIISEFPAAFGDYYEPFLGGGSVFFALNYLACHRTYRRAHLSDTNARLINCWQRVKDSPEHVKQMLQHCLAQNSEEFYYRMRREMGNPAVFLYVMRAAFSSMYRENKRGEFNVPYRKQDFESGKVISFDMEHLSACSEYMRQKDVQLVVASFLAAVQDAKAGDVVYFDPPYLPYTDNGFVDYVAGGFGFGEHTFLNSQCKLLMERGVFVALSNSDVPASRRLYGNPHKVLTVSNAVKAKATTKGTRSEGLWIWDPNR